jgi:hypothetical protein
MAKRRRRTAIIENGAPTAAEVVARLQSFFGSCPSSELRHVLACTACHDGLQARLLDAELTAEVQRELLLKAKRRALSTGPPGRSGRRQAVTDARILEVLKTMPNAKRYEQATVLGVTEKTLRRRLRALRRG